MPLGSSSAAPVTRPGPSVLRKPTGFNGAAEANVVAIRVTFSSCWPSSEFVNMPLAAVGAVGGFGGFRHECRLECRTAENRLNRWHYPSRGNAQDGLYSRR